MLKVSRNTKKRVFEIFFEKFLHSDVAHIPSPPPPKKIQCFTILIMAIDLTQENWISSHQSVTFICVAIVTTVWSCWPVMMIRHVNRIAHTSPPPSSRGSERKLKKKRNHFAQNQRSNGSLATTHTSWEHFTRKTRRFSSHFLGNNSFSSSYDDIIMGDLCLRSNAPGPTHPHTPADVTCLIMSIVAVVWPRAFGGVCM